LTRPLLTTTWNGAGFPTFGWTGCKAPGPWLSIGVPAIVLFQVLIRKTAKDRL